MRVAVVHNPTAGDRSVSGADLRDAITSAGHDVESYTSTRQSSWQDDVANGVDLVVAAGGDGTVRKVLTTKAGSGEVVTLLPLGTCNNMARTLGFPIATPLSGIAMWRDGMAPSRYHLPHVTCGHFAGRCIEGAGAGIFAELIRRADDAGADPDDSWPLLSDVIDDAPSKEWTISLDGTAVAGEFLAVVATVVRHTGPNLWIAPAADPSSPHLEVVLVGEAQRRDLTKYVDRRRRGRQPASIPFDAVQARRVEIQPPHRVTRSVDDLVLDETTHPLTVEASDEFVRVLIPRQEGR
jgi:diacylglycerol kinase (ATP)